MEVIVIVAIAAFGAAFCWFLWRIRRCFKDIKESLDRIETNLEVFSDQLTILLYLAVRNNPDLLEKSPDLEKKALEAAKRLEQKQLTTGAIFRKKPIDIERAKGKEKPNTTERAN